MSDNAKSASKPLVEDNAALAASTAARFPFLKTKRGIALVVLAVLVVIGGGLAGLAALPKGNRTGSSPGRQGDGGGDAEAITDDGYFYGLSPPVYPSPNMASTGRWAEAYGKAKALVEKMTLEDKVSLTGGASSNTGCSGFIPAIPRLNFPGMCLSDAGNGVRGTDLVSVWPSGIHVGASWNKALTRQRALGMGGEFRTKGVNVLLGPAVGPLGRVVLNGRNWEGFSSDPYLAGVLAYETVSAVQSVGVITSTKHYIGNEQETNRNPSGDVESVSSNIDDRAMHELYLCKSLNGLLKTELGFQGWVVSDWGGLHTGYAAALAGLDVVMPFGNEFWGEHLVEAVGNGTVPESRIDDMILRVLSSWYLMGQDQGFPQPGIGMASDLTKPHAIVDARNSSFRSTLLDGAAEGHVLVKNIRNALPLKQPKLLSLFGYSAKNPDRNNPSPNFSPWLWGAESFNYTEFAGRFYGYGGSYTSTPIAVNGTLYSGGGSGATSQSTVISPFDALTHQAYDDGTQLFWDFVSGTPHVNALSGACLVFGNAYAAEAADRPGLSDDYTDNLIRHVAERCNNTIVIFHNAGIRLVEAFADHPNVTAILFAHLPGEASGRALVDILYGRANPSGKLPYTVARKESDYPVLGPDVAAPGSRFERFPQSNFSEGVFVDYRHFDAKNITPRYPFGFGLSYTSFEYSNLAVQKKADAGLGFDEYPSGPVIEGGQQDLWDVLVEVTADVANTGKLDGAEVAQLYVGIPDDGAPVRQLRGFEKPFVQAGETASVKFELTRRDLSVWDVEAQKWRLVKGEHRIEVGGSSRDLPLVGKVVI
ncbi:hypothetical protein VTJ83DRAFT_3552 [Remersonia thermophila]|uniref:beta-glucosidase n=1 Tax=Remersonia thermophila TaxID=72144 RepID=A0ABR4DEG0_9PEZI